MFHSSSSYSQGLVSLQPTHAVRRWRPSGATAAILTVAAILASGVAVGQLDASHSRPHYQTSQSQPFDHFPR